MNISNFLLAEFISVKVKPKIQAFLEALHPVQQFAFRIKFLRDDNYDEKIEHEEISNSKTGEKLSIICFGDDDNDYGYTLEIKLSKAEVKKGSKNGGK